MISFTFNGTTIRYDEHDETLDLFKSTSDFRGECYLFLEKYIKSLKSVDLQNREMMCFVDRVLKPYFQVEAYKEKRLASLKLFKNAMIQLWVEKLIKTDYSDPAKILATLGSMRYDPTKKIIFNPVYYYLFNHGTKSKDSMLHSSDRPTSSMKQCAGILHGLYNKLSPEIKVFYEMSYNFLFKFDEVSHSDASKKQLDDSSSSVSDDEPPAIPPAVIVGSPIKSFPSVRTPLNIGYKNISVNPDLHAEELIFGHLCDAINVNDIKKMIETPAEGNPFLDYFKKYLVVEPFRKSRQADLRHFKQAMLKVIRDNPQEDWVTLLDYMPATKLPISFSFHGRTTPAHVWGKSLFKFLMDYSTKSDKPISHTNLFHPTASMSELLKILDKADKEKKAETANAFRQQKKIN